MEIYGWGATPKYLKEFSESWLQGKGPLPHKLLMFTFAGFAWDLWITRNKVAIEKKYPKAPTDVVYVALSFLQKWCTLLKQKDRVHVEKIKDDIMGWLKGFKPSAVLLTDIMEI